ncbi:MAG: amidohydrolase family protein [Solirubrobacteraceae bacterium]
MLDLIIRNATVVAGQGTGKWDIAISGERVVAVSAPGSLPDEAVRIVDAEGKIVVPGGIEPHTHLSDPLVERLWDQDFIQRATTDDPLSEGLAPASLGPEGDTVGMAFGGVTTHIDFAWVNPTVGLQEAVNARVDRWRGNSYVDFAFHVGLCGPVPLPTLDEIPAAIQQGFTSFKFFTSEVLAHRPYAADAYKIDAGRMAYAFEKIAANGGLAAVHAEDDEIVQFNYEKFAAEGRSHERWNQHLIHTSLSERLSFWHTILLAEYLDTAVYFVHVSARDGVDAIRQARSRGLPVFGETLSQYVCRTSKDYTAPRGLCHHTYPSLKSDEDQAALREALWDGSMATIATDEVPTTLEIKLSGSTVEDVVGGNVGAEARMGIIFTEGVSKGRISLERYVAITATNAARLFGLYPKKGVIAVGSDADIAIIDPSVKKALTAEDFHVGDYSPWEGWEVEGWPVTTILRGKTIVDSGRLLGTTDDGELVRARKIDRTVVESPVV